MQTGCALRLSSTQHTRLLINVFLDLKAESSFFFLFACFNDASEPEHGLYCL